jgi:chromatin remodeling complex protein RSC6
MAIRKTRRATKIISAKTVARKKASSKREICFTIMPFGGWFDSYYQEIYCPAIENCNLEPKRADDLYRPSNIVQDIWSLTRKAKIILADLTNKNANVFYELGLAHSLAKPAILITENIEDIPFDLRSLRIIEYDKNVPDWGVVLMKSIEKAINETLQSPNETIPTAFLEVSASKKTIPAQEKEYLELREEIELLKREVRSSSFRNTNFSEPIEATRISNANQMMKLLTPSRALATIIGDDPIQRTMAVKLVWDYIKKNNLQDAKERRNINADSNLQKVLGGKKTVSMFELAKYLSKNLS